MVSFSEDVRYGFAVGRIRALETTLIDRARYDRLARAPDYAGFLIGVADTFYGRYFAEGPEGGDFDAMIGAAAAANLAFLRQYCLDGWVYRLFRLEDDVNNLKVVLKERAAGRGHDPARLVADGLLSGAELAALAAGEPGSEPSEIRDALAGAGWRQGREPDPMEIDITLDRLAQRLRLGWAAPSPFLRGYFSLNTDVENIRTFVRVKAFGDGRPVLERALLPGGTTDAAGLMRLLDEEWDAFVAAFRLSAFSRLAEEAARGVGAGTFRTLERIGRELGLEYLLAARYATFGYEPLVSYYLFRRNEHSNLRQLAAAKRAGLDETACRGLVAHVG